MADSVRGDFLEEGRRGEMDIKNCHGLVNVQCVEDICPFYKEGYCRKPPGVNGPELRSEAYRPVAMGGLSTTKPRRRVLACRIKK